jgi:hypothetical protein
MNHTKNAMNAIKAMPPMTPPTMAPMGAFDDEWEPMTEFVAVLEALEEDVVTGALAEVWDTVTNTVVPLLPGRPAGLVVSIRSTKRAYEIVEQP